MPRLVSEGAWPRMSSGHPPPVKVIVGALYRDEGPWAEAVAGLEELLGPAETRTAPLPFEFSSYYKREMGADLLRTWLAFEDLRPGDGLADLKLAAGRIEGRLARADGTRRVNLDPGFLSIGGLVLASTKEATHRVYLRDGIWAELTLWFHAGVLNELPWTYPDYGDERTKSWLTGLREAYKEQSRLVRRKEQAG